MKKPWALGCVGLVVWSVAVACAGDGDRRPDSDKEVIGKPSTAGAGGEREPGATTVGGAESAPGGSGGAEPTAEPAVAGGGGAGGEVTAGGAGGAQPSGVFVPSRPPGIELVIEDPEQARGLTFSSLNIQNKAGASYAEWLGALVNHGDEVMCLVAINGDFQDSKGVTVVQFDGYVTGRAYDIGASKLASPCIAPGESVPVWTNLFPEAPLALETVTKLIVAIDPVPMPDAVVHPATPTLSALERSYSATDEMWAISGTATSTADIHLVRADFWGKDGEFFVGWDYVHHVADFLKGETWEISTPLGIPAVSVTDVIPYFSFIEGLEADAARVRFDAATLALLERHHDAMRSFSETRARHDELRRRLGY